MAETAMDLSDTDDLVRLVRESASSFTKGDDASRGRGLRGGDPGFDRAVWSEMAANGWTGMVLAEADGGQDAGFAAMGALAGTLARAVTPEPLTAVAVLSALAVAGCPESALRRRLLDGITSGDMVLATGFQGEGGSLDPADTPLAFDGQTVTGTLRHVFPALGADGFVVAAQGSDGLSLVHVPASGATIERELRADGSFSGRVAFAAAPGDVLATGDAARHALDEAIAAAVAVSSAELLGLIERALEITLDYMRVRVQFGRPIGSFQALQHRAVDLWIAQELTRGAVSEALAALDAGATGDARRFVAGRAKSRAGDAALTVCRECIKLHGAIGFTDEHDVGLYLRRALTLSAWLGNAAQHRRGVAGLIDLSADVAETSAASQPVDAFFLQDEPADVDWNAFPDDEFRAGVRAWFERNLPAKYKGRASLETEETRDWTTTVARKGWYAPQWPREWGGMELSPAKQVIFMEEREAAGAPKTADMGMYMLGPVLMRFGTEEQKRKYLPDIVNFKTWWCQGYSEPNAGSDLASLQTEAVPDGDEFVINGSKIWTSNGHRADMMFMLVRTDKTVKKQEGISFILVDLNAPGVKRRGIENLAGEEIFAEEFFDDVRVPKENLVGELNKGWTVAKALLGFERLGVGSPRRVQKPLRQVRDIARAAGVLDRSDVMARYTQLHLDVLDLGALYNRFAAIVQAGGSPGPDISMLKIFAGETNQAITAFMIEVAGSAGNIRSLQDFGGKETDLLGPYYTVYSGTIAGGSNDIQRNIIARRVLDLPKE